MAPLSGCSTNNSAATMLESSGPATSVPSCANPPPPMTESWVASAPVDTSPSFVLSTHDLTQVFIQALGDSLPHFLAALQSHSMNTHALVSHYTLAEACYRAQLVWIPLPSILLHLLQGFHQVIYCTIGNSYLTSISLFASCVATNAALPTIGQSSSLELSASSVRSSAILPGITSSLNRPFVVGPGYSHIPEKLVTKISLGQFVNMANLLAKNLQVQEMEPQPYLNCKHLVSSSKKRVQDITDIVTWIEAFSVYMWIFCCAHPSRWQHMTQYKLLILKTLRQFPGKAWLCYDTAFQKDATTTSLAD